MKDQCIFFKTLVPNSPWVQSGGRILQRSALCLYNATTKILAVQIVEEGSLGSDFKTLGPPSLAQVDDPCSVFNFIGIEVKRGRLLECEILDDEEVSAPYFSWAN